MSCTQRSMISPQRFLTLLQVASAGVDILAGEGKFDVRNRFSHRSKI